MDLKLNKLIKEYSYERWADDILAGRENDLCECANRVVSNSCLSLSRNVAGINFPPQCKPKELLTVRNMLKAYIGKTFPHAKFFNADQLMPLELGMMFNQGFYREELAEKNSGAAYVFDFGAPWFYLLVNQDDHLRLVYDDSVARLWQGWRDLDKLDNKISKGIDFAWNQDLGYLCSNPDLTGTGLSVSVSMQLVGILMLGRYDELVKPLESSIFKLSPIEPMDSPLVESGKTMKFTFNFDRRTSEKQQIYLAETAIGIISKFECECREELAKNRKLLLMDWLARAVALAKNSELVTASEARYFHSAFRFAVVEGIANRRNVDDIDRQFAHLWPLDTVTDLPSFGKDRYFVDHKRAEFLQKAFKSFRLVNMPDKKS